MSLLNKLMGNASAETPESLREKYGQLLMDNEEIEIGFKLMRDTFMFTNKRMVLIDIQGLTGKKTEYLSIPYKVISRFSLETAGTFDMDAELKIWISSGAAPAISKKFNKSIDVYEVQKYLASKVL